MSEEIKEVDPGANIEVETKKTTLEKQKEKPKTRFSNVNEWVEQWLSKTINRDLIRKGDYRWRSNWWMYPEAAEVLSALWLSWEYYYGQPRISEARGIWWVNYAYPLLEHIMSPTGPFIASGEDYKTDKALNDDGVYELPCVPEEEKEDASNGWVKGKGKDETAKIVENLDGS